MKTNKLMLGAAIAGLVAAGATLGSTSSAAGAAKVHCAGANACKGKGGCKSAENACKGQNGCKGKSYTETTKAACEKMAKKNKEIHVDDKPAS